MKAKVDKNSDKSKQTQLNFGIKLEAKADRFRIFFRKTEAKAEKNT